MYINSLKLVNYRNYDNLLVDFNKKVNLIIGMNGQGKTNIVEAIGFMSIGRSFRTNKDKELIKFSADNLYCSCKFTKNNIDKKIEIFVSKEKKGIKVNGVSIKSIQELLGNLNVVIFSPEDLRLVKDGPRERRTFIDKEISQIMPRYYSLLTSYNKILLQRNKVLKSYSVDENLLDVYDETMSDYASEIYIIRNRFIEKLSLISRNIHKSLTMNKENLTIKYKNQLEIDNFKDPTYIRSNFIDKLREARQGDILTRSTRFGPHKDDIKIFINDIDVRMYGSQGQQRTASISLKLSEIELIKQEVGDYPILILDDVFSELDQSRQKLLVEKLDRVQMFVTSADPFHKNILGVSDYSIFSIENGRIIGVENGGV
nr:DNA replication/repair protein RecF [uncultured Peptostreptococcus sp.]